MREPEGSLATDAILRKIAILFVVCTFILGVVCPIVFYSGPATFMESAIIYKVTPAFFLIFDIILSFNVFKATRAACARTHPSK